MGHLSRFQSLILPYTYPEPVQEVHAFSETKPVQSTAIRPLHSACVCSGQRGQVYFTTKGYKDPPLPRRLVGQARSHQICLQHTQTLVALCQELGWLVNKDISELVPKQVFNFIGYQFDLREGRVRPTQERWQTLQTKIRALISGPVCPVWKLMSLIGLLTATEKQEHLGHLHRSKIVFIATDNTTVVAYINKKGG